MNRPQVPSSSKYQRGRPGRTISTLLAALVCMASTVAAAKTHSVDAPRKTAGAPGQAAKAYKLDGELTRRSNDHRSGRSLTRVIVTLVPGAQLPSEFRKYSRNTSLDLINGEVLDLPNQMLASMAAHPSVFRVHYDRPITSHNYRTAVTVGARTVQQSLGYTGAVMQKKGKFELASGGTLFLDEVGELPTSLQVKLLRVLQEREIERLGGTKTIKLNVRLIAATNRDLEAEVARGAFRRDLLYRLKVVTIVPPPLRECGDDIVRLARHFVARFSREMVRHVRGISPEAEQMLKSYDWPGNVRQLQNFMERAIVVGSTDMVLPADLPVELTQPLKNFTAAASASFQDITDTAQRHALQKALEQTDGNLKEAAKLLGLNPTYIYRVVKRLGLCGK